MRCKERVEALSSSIAVGRTTSSEIAGAAAMQYVQHPHRRESIKDQDTAKAISSNCGNFERPDEAFCNRYIGHRGQDNISVGLTSSVL